MTLFRVRSVSLHSVPLCFTALVGIATLAGCDSLTQLPGEEQNSDDPGALALALELSPGVDLDLIEWEITGNGLQRSGSIDVSGSTLVSALIGGIPAGSSYLITLSGVDAAGLGIQCRASAEFDVAARATTRVGVTLRCQVPRGTGSVVVEGNVNVCPVIDSLSASPLQATLGSPVFLSAEARDLDSGPDALSYSWTATGGTLGNADTSSALLVCDSVGTHQVSLEVSDGDCSDSVDLVVTCSEAAPGRALVVINELESSGGVPDDWAELYNAGDAPADLSGWTFLDNDDTHVYTLAAGTILQPGAFLVIESAELGYGLGSADSGRLFDGQGTLVDSYSWVAHALTTYGRCPDGLGAFVTTTNSTKGLPNDCSSPVVINEVESSGGVPGDWVELYNPSAAAADISGFIFKDNDDTHAYALPEGTILAPGAFLALDEAVFGFGLGAADSARLFDRLGVTLVDGTSWTAHAATTYGRCPDGAGEFVTTVEVSKGAANACPAPADAATPWPGTDDVQILDPVGTFSGNMSGLTYQAGEAGAPGVLWAVQNGPSMLYRLVQDGATWQPDPTPEWSLGKLLHYPDGTGAPDAEGVSLSGGFAYVATERNNDANAVSRLSVLRFDPSDPGLELSATHEWELTADLPAVGPNLGLEAIAFIPDAFLVASGFLDEVSGAPYDPALHPDHGSGLFFVGVEGTGLIYAFALDHVGLGFQRVATLESGFPGVMGLEFDADSGTLFAACDDSCQGQINLFQIASDPALAELGQFVIAARWARPSSMPNLNNEGIAIVPEAECSAGVRGFFWVDDAATNGFSLRGDALECRPLLPAL